MSKAVKRVPEPHEDGYVDPYTGRIPWREIRRWEAGAKPSDVFKSDLDLLPWQSKSKLSEQMTRNSNTYPRRGSSSGFYVEYIERLIQRRAAKGEQKADLDAEEQYWRERERLHAERQQIKRAA